MRAALAILAVAGCLGEPTVGRPSEVTVLFALELAPTQEDNCKTRPYIGNAAFGADRGYVLTHAYLPGCSGGGGNPEEDIPSSVYELDKRTPGENKIGEAGLVREGGGRQPRLAVRGSDAVWAYPVRNNPSIMIESRSTSIGGAIGSNVNSLAALVMDDTRTFTIAWGGPFGPSNLLSPRYPCCGGSGGSPPNFSFFAFTNATPPAVTGFPITPMFVVEQLKEPLVANTSSLYFWQRPATTAALVEYPKSGGTTTVEIATAAATAWPAGLAADDAHIAWATSFDFRLFGNGGPSPDACAISATTVAQPRTEIPLVQTAKFTCGDIALDGNHVYFTIVDVIEASSHSLVTNRGVGRVDLTTREYETLALDITGVDAGPRQLFVDGDGLILVTPVAVARIAKAALAGKRDIEK